MAERSTGETRVPLSKPPGSLAPATQGQWPNRLESLATPGTRGNYGELTGSLSSVETVTRAMVPPKDSETHEGDRATRDRGADPHKGNSGTYKKDSDKQEKDSSPRNGKTIPHILIQPAIPRQLAFRNGSSKGNLKKAADQEKLRTQLIEEAKQRKILDQATSNRETTTEANKIGIPHSSGKDSSGSRILASRQVKLDSTNPYSASPYGISSQTGASTSPVGNSSLSQSAYDFTHGRYKRHHHDAIILSSEKMSPAKDGTIAHLGTVKILPAKTRVPSFSGIIEDAGEIVSPLLTAGSNATATSTHASSSRGGLSIWDTNASAGQVSPLFSSTFDPTAQEFSPERLRGDYPASLFHEREKARVPDRKSWLSNSAGSEVVYSPSHYGSSALPSPLDSPTARFDRIDQAITNHIKDIRNHAGQVRDGLILHVKAKHAASSCLVATRCDAIEAMSKKHHEEAREKLVKLSDDVTAIRSESVDFAAGLESVTEFAGKMNDNFAAGFESLESKAIAMDKKLDSVGRAVSAMDRRLIAAKDDINEVNFRVGDIKEKNAAFHANQKSLLGKCNIFIDHQAVESERLADLSADLKSLQRENKTFQDNQTAQMQQVSELLVFLRTENEKLRLENQKLRENNPDTNTVRPDLTNTLLSVLQKLEANESRIDQILNAISNGGAYPWHHQQALLSKPSDATHKQYHSANGSIDAMMHVPAASRATSPSLAPIHPANISNWYHHANSMHQGQ
ncbi:MAG: hypothetical protein M1840_006847 [Geoglossum simile]|nr:MAG: hypothetical protein M1840_006847 [Geoglossum simile]